MMTAEINPWPSALSPPRTEHLNSFNFVRVYRAVSEWELGAGIDVLSAAMLVTAMATAGGNTLAELAVQTAEVRTDAPGAWQVVTSGVAVTGAGGNANGAVSVSSYTASKMWVRWGISFVMAAGATAPAEADVMVTIASVQKAMFAGSWRGQLVSSTTSDAVVAISAWVPVAWAQKVLAGLIVSSCGSATTFKCRLVYRTAQSSQDAPGAWTDTADAAPQTGGNLERPAADSALSLGSNMWVQFGLAYWSTSGTSIAEVSAVVAVRRT